MNAVWSRVKERLGQSIDSRDFATWIEPLVPKTEGVDDILLSAPNRFIQDWFTENFLGPAHEAAKEIHGRPVAIRVELTEPKKAAQLDFGNGILGEANKPEQPAPPRKRPAKTRFSAENVGLNPRYQFDRFVVGSSNDFAHAACLAAARKPGKSFNPLFLYGGTGLGKTHLLHAIGHYLMADKGDRRIAAFTAEGFANEMIGALQAGHINAFRNRMRQVDALLIDDVQFLIGKERTQIEFFHTFNAIHERGGQIAMTSDRPPRELTELHERLSSRLSWGLIADIQPADLETRIAILRRRAEETDSELPDDTAWFLAENFAGSVRDLEGAFVRVMAFASFRGRRIDLDIARQSLKSFLGDEDKPVSVEMVQKAVCHFYQVKMTDLTGKSRQQSLVFPRQIAGYLSRELTDASFPDIARRFGGRDHSTIMHAHKKIESMRKTDAALDRSIEEIRRRVKGA